MLQNYRVASQVVASRVVLSSIDLVIISNFHFELDGRPKAVEVLKELLAVLFVHVVKPQTCSQHLNH
jgi:hypothetical protein